MKYARIVGEDGDIDYVPMREKDFHYTDCIDPTSLNEEDIESGTVLRCLCSALVSLQDDGTMHIWHRELL